MGKRKREENREEEEDAQDRKRIKVEPADEDENGNDSDDSSLSSIVLPEELYNETADDPNYTSRPKKRDTIPNYSSSEDITNGLHSESPRKEKKKSTRSSETNGINGIEEGSSDYTFYLIRKPIDVSIDQLENMKLSKLADGKNVKLKTEKGNFILKPEQVPKPLVYFPSTVIMTEKDAQKIKSGGFITSQAVLTPHVKEIPGGPLYNNEEEIPEDLKMFPISSIRKKPKVDWKNKQERLKAFGVKPEKKRKSKTPKLEPVY